MGEMTRSSAATMVLLLSLNKWTAEAFVTPSTSVAFCTPKSAVPTAATTTSWSRVGRLFSIDSDTEETPEETSEEEAPEVEDAADSEIASDAVAAIEETPLEGDERPIPGPEAGTTCYVGNLPIGLSETELKQIFEAYGEVAAVAIPVDRFSGQPRSFGFVTMFEKEATETAMSEVDGTEVGGNILSVKESVPRGQKPRQYDEVEGNIKIYVGNIRYETSKDELSEFFSQFGTVDNVFLPTDRETGEARGFAFLSMPEDDGMKAIEATDGTEFQGRILNVNKSLPRGQKAPRRNKGYDETKVYVGNLSFDTETDALRDMFEEYGYVRDVYIPVDRDTGRPRGFAFVNMDNEAAQRAIEEVDGCELDGRIIRVNEAQNRN